MWKDQNLKVQEELFLIKTECDEYKFKLKDIE
jgi:hypothetical protein